MEQRFELAKVYRVHSEAGNRYAAPIHRDFNGSRLLAAPRDTPSPKRRLDYPSMRSELMSLLSYSPNASLIDPTVWSCATASVLRRRTVVIADRGRSVGNEISRFAEIHTPACQKPWWNICSKGRGYSQRVVSARLSEIALNDCSLLPAGICGLVTQARSSMSYDAECEVASKKQCHRLRE